MSTTVATSAPGTRERSLRRLTALQIGLLATQFLVGMVVNLFVTVPSQHPGTNANDYFTGVARGVLWALGNATLMLRLHVVIGLVLAVVSLWMVWLAVRARRRVWIVATLVGASGIFAAGFNGASFMNYTHNFSSLLMAIGFLICALGYGLGAYVAR